MQLFHTKNVERYVYRLFVCYVFCETFLNVRRTWFYIEQGLFRLIFTTFVIHRPTDFVMAQRFVDLHRKANNTFVNIAHSRFYNDVFLSPTVAILAHHTPRSSPPFWRRRRRRRRLRIHRTTLVVAIQKHGDAQSSLGRVDNHPTRFISSQ